MSGIKYDTGKVDMGLLFREVPYGLEEISKALQMGSDKYGVGNWLKVDDGNSRYLSALVRHLTAYYQGEAVDKESGLSHLVHVATNAMFLADLEKRNNDNSGLSSGCISSGQPNDSWVTAEVGQIQKDIHSTRLDYSWSEGAGIRLSRECVEPVSVENCFAGGTGRPVYIRHEG